jgi:hypothetical protein
MAIAIAPNPQSSSWALWGSRGRCPLRQCALPVLPAHPSCHRARPRSGLYCRRLSIDLCSFHTHKPLNRPAQHVCSFRLTPPSPSPVTSTTRLPRYCARAMCPVAVCCLLQQTSASSMATASPLSSSSADGNPRPVIGEAKPPHWRMSTPTKPCALYTIRPPSTPAFKPGPSQDA